MAELIGVAASVVGLAGAAATVSLKIYEFVDTVWHAKKELNALAIEASDLSTVLNHLGAVLDQNSDSILSKTIETANTLVGRCKNLLREIDATIDLVKAKSTRATWLLRKRKTQQMKLSLESFKSTLSLMIQTVTLGKVMKEEKSKNENDPKSARVRRNINVLSSAILSNRRLVEELNAAEEVTEESETDETESKIGETDPKSKQTPAAILFQQDYALATAPPSTSTIGPPTQNISASIFKEYDERQHDPPASAAIYSSLPAPFLQARAQSHPLAIPPQQSSVSELERPQMESGTTKKEIRLLLNEWTNTEMTLVSEYLVDSQSSEGSGERPSEPSGHPQEDNVPEQEQSSRADPSEQAEDRSKPFETPPEPQILTLEAWSQPNNQRKPLIDSFSEFGGGYVWRHEDQFTHWYFIRDKFVIEYRIRPQPTSSTHTDLRGFKTVISKQWVSKDVLAEAGYHFQDYGEGGYSINGKLTPQDVHNLHLSASGRKEGLLRRLANTKPKYSQRKLVKAIWDFEAQTPTHISFQKGEMFDADIDDSVVRWMGHKPDGSGYIPAQYVEVVIHPRETERQIVKALHDFKAEHPAHIDLKKGTVFEAETFRNTNWWKGYLDGASGGFPASYVEVISSVSSSSTTTDQTA